MFINVDYSPSPYPSHQGRGLFINPLPWWERAGVRGGIVYKQTFKQTLIMRGGDKK
jgi:hypothetical protein